jgi:hypothetical protein
LPANGHHPPFQVGVDYEAVRARKREALDKESAELAASISARPHPLRSSAHTRVIRHAKAVAGPSRIPLDGHSRTGASDHEIQLLTALAGGDGISPYDNQGFIEECGVCHHFFLGSVLISSHIFSCSRS